MTPRSMTPLGRIAHADLCAEAIGGKRVSDTELIAALQRVAAVHDGSCTTTAYYGAYMAMFVSPSPRTFYLRYGSWVAALEAAGLTPARRPRQYANRLTESDLLRPVRACAEALGRLPTLAEYRAWRTPSVHPCDSTIRERLGGWAGVLRLLLAEASA